MRLAMVRRSGSCYRKRVGLIRGRSSMTARKLLLAALLAAAASPASASVMVVGSSAARACYRGGGFAARAGLPRISRSCDQALRDEALVRARCRRHPRQSRHPAAAPQPGRRGDPRFRRSDRARSQPARSLSEQGRGADAGRECRRWRCRCSPRRWSATRPGRSSPITAGRSPTRRWAMSAPLMTITGGPAS